jgi:hypothetical protein
MLRWIIGNGKYTIDIVCVKYMSDGANLFNEI